MRDEDVVRAIVKDGNRIVSWDMPYFKTLATVLRKYRRGYRQFREDSVHVNGTPVPQEEFCRRIGEFDSRKVVVSVKSIRRKKRKKEETADVC